MNNTVQAIRAALRSKSGNITPKMVCADGLRLSVQASSGHYCIPREDDAYWTAVEVGYPTLRIEQFMPYIDGLSSDPTDTVCGYVPIEIVAAVIDEHGGLKGEAQS